VKIEREGQPAIIIGKRVTIGQLIASCVTIGAFTWDSFNPESPLPAGVVMGITQVITGIVQVIVVNRYGATQ
jgi:hypothetical protein